MSSFDPNFPPSRTRNRSPLIYIFIIGILVLLYASNPSLQDHRDAVTSKITQLMQQNVAANENDENALGKAGTEIGLMLGKEIVNKFVEELVERKNFLFFSLTTVEYQGDEKIIGLGIFGNVFISDDVERGLEDMKDRLKSNFDEPQSHNNSGDAQQDSNNNQAIETSAASDSNQNLQADTSLVNSNGDTSKEQ